MKQAPLMNGSPSSRSRKLFSWIPGIESTVLTFKPLDIISTGSKDSTISDEDEEEEEEEEVVVGGGGGTAGANSNSSTK
jgi:hypothetical protein